MCQLWVQIRLKVFHYAFSLVISICAGFLYRPFVWLIYSISGVSLVYPVMMCLLIFAEFMEFITVTILSSSFNPLGALIMTLMGNGRHLLEGRLQCSVNIKIKAGKHLILYITMCDESFTINATADISENIDLVQIYFWVTLLN